MTPAQSKTIDWICNGEIGCSSKQLAMWVAFGKMTDGSFPYDPADFDRCLKYLGRVPEARADLYRMADVSPVWKALIEHWDEIEASQLEEIGINWTKGRSAPKTYKLMRSIIDRAERHTNTSREPHG